MQNFTDILVLILISYSQAMKKEMNTVIVATSIKAYVYHPRCGKLWCSEFYFPLAYKFFQNILDTGNDFSPMKRRCEKINL